MPKRTNPQGGSQQMTVTVGKKARTKSTASKKSAVQKSLFPTGFSSVVPRFGFPLRLAMKHRYCDIVQVTSTAGAIDHYLFKCNAMFDPNQTGAGHQPLYFDELSAIYNHYTVLASNIKIRACSSTALPVGCIVSLHVDDDTTSSANIQTICEQSTASFKVVPFGNQDQIYLTKAWSAKDYFGPNPLDNDTLQGTGSTDPSELSFYNFSINSLSAGTQSLQLLVEISYWAVWDELKTNAGS